MAVSTRHQWAARQMGRPLDPLLVYEVLDPFHQPDMNGELAGGKVYKVGDKQYVRLTEQQARFYLDSGSIAEVKPEEPGGNGDTGGTGATGA
jgi:hypothetical protein